jgi:hypothetical protein
MTMTYGGGKERPMRRLARQAHFKGHDAQAGVQERVHCAEVNDNMREGIGDRTL